MDTAIRQYIAGLLKPGITLGIIGFSELGREVRNLAATTGIEDILVCDPQAAYAEAEEIGEEFFGLWGNGMGGCTLTGEGLQTFLPLERLVDADLLVLAGFQNGEKTFKISAAFLASCKPDAIFINLCGQELLEKDALANPRLRLMP